MNLSPEQVFSLANTVALLGWIALVASPPSARWSPWSRLFAGRVLPLALGAVYVAMMLLYWTGEGGFSSLAEVQKLFAVPGLLTGGWIHYLAFDLFVGAWIAERGAALGLPHWQLVPALLLTFLFGPAGLLAFFLLRALRRPGSFTLPAGVR